MSDFVQQKSFICSFNSNEGWVILSPIELSIKHKVDSIGIPLKDWSININYGIKTGFNAAFIINSNKRQEILRNCKTEKERQKTAELIRPILRGRDIKRYSYEYADLYLIATFPSKNYNIEDYPEVKKHLLSFGKERLEQTGKKYLINGEEIKARKKTNNKWFETQDSISYWEEFNKPRIVYCEIGSEMDACMVDAGVFINNKLYMVTGDYLEYLI
ncbi:MAG: class I SAM-dependent DNA methyltransferase, partial [Spirochaetia bacterium]|nr:class I SAM-dependent DNA methyltransferase [Spirochaetia bacterium]